MSKVFFECNRRKCLNCSYPLCRYTEDIEYAENFKNEFNGYIEKIDDFGYSVKHLNSKWIKRINENYSPFDPCAEEYVYICSRCITEQDHASKYCPNCGAKMDYGTDDA